MERFILLAIAVVLGTSAVAPAASAKQASTASELSPTATIHDLVQNNRDMRSSK